MKPSGGRLHGKTAIVTGGTEGIGAAVARSFCAEGAQLLLVARREEPGRRLVEELGSGRARFLAADVSEESTARDAVSAAVAAFGRVDVLVNNAAVDFVRDILDTDRADLERVFAANFFGAFAMLRECGRVMRNQGAGSIVNITSRNASVGVPSMGAYAAAKGALLSLTRIAAIEWADAGVRVNAVAPGLTETPLIRAWIDGQPEPARFRSALVESVPLGRLAQPEDVAQAIVYLASDESAHVTGASIPVDGGYTAR
ncbi:MAG: glucose 1-dehydrogenase [Chloroflexi bacterium]|nr:MAG: glucose 1-dehydrogenase [Chloroflexota bacterium]